MRDRTILLTGAPHPFATELLDELLEAGSMVWATVATLPGGARTLGASRFVPVHGWPLGPTVARKLVNRVDTVINVSVRGIGTTPSPQRLEGHARSARILLDEALAQGRLFFPLVIQEPAEPGEEVTPDAAEADALLEDVRLRATAGRLRHVGCTVHDVYGPGIDRGFMADLVDVVLKGDPLALSHSGRVLRSPVFVNDATQAVHRLLSMRLAEGRHYDVASPAPVSERDLGERVLRRTRQSPELLRVVAGAMPSAPVLPSPLALRNATGWSPRTALAQGISRTVAHAVLMSTGLGTTPPSGESEIRDQSA